MSTRAVPRTLNTNASTISHLRHRFGEFSMTANHPNARRHFYDRGMSSSVTSHVSSFTEQMGRSMCDSTQRSGMLTSPSYAGWHTVCRGVLVWAGMSHKHRTQLHAIVGNHNIRLTQTAQCDSKVHGSTQKRPLWHKNAQFDTKMPFPACISWLCHNQTPALPWEFFFQFYSCF